MRWTWLCWFQWQVRLSVRFRRSPTHHPPTCKRWGGTRQPDDVQFVIAQQRRERRRRRGERETDKTKKVSPRIIYFVVATVISEYAEAFNYTCYTHSQGRPPPACIDAPKIANPNKTRKRLSRLWHIQLFLLIVIEPPPPAWLQMTLFLFNSSLWRFSFFRGGHRHLNFFP
jgi:hypothetical protein